MYIGWRNVWIWKKYSNTFCPQNAVYYSLYIKLYEMNSLLLSPGYDSMWTLLKFVIGFWFGVQASERLEIVHFRKWTNVIQFSLILKKKKDQISKLLTQSNIVKKKYQFHSSRIQIWCHLLLTENPKTIYLSLRFVKFSIIQ